MTLTPPPSDQPAPLTEQPVAPPVVPIALPPPIRRAPARDNTVTLDRTVLNYIATAMMFFIAGYIVSWAVFASTTGNIIAEVRAAASSGASEAVATGVARIGTNQIASNIPTATPTPIPIQKIEIGDAPFWGPADAKVVIVEFSDFECPFCNRYYHNEYQEMKQRYGDKIKYVFMDMPLQQHPNAFPAALAARCAKEQDKFWVYHDILFESQSLSPDSLISAAQKAGVANMDQFKTCFSTQKYKSVIDGQISYGTSKFVGGTPTFFINGQIQAGTPRYVDQFWSYIDYLIKTA